MDEGEQVEHAAIREIWEETRLKISLDGLVSLFWPLRLAASHVYSARLDAAKPEAGEVPRPWMSSPPKTSWDCLAFPSTRDALRGLPPGSGLPTPSPSSVCMPAEFFSDQPVQG